MSCRDVLADLGQFITSLRRLPAGLATDLREGGHRVDLRAGEVVFQPGDVCSALTVVLSGCIRVGRLAPDGREILLYNVLPGEFCLLTVTSLLGKVPCAAEVRATVPTKAFLIPAGLFARLLSEAPDFFEAVFRGAAARLDEIMTRLEEVAFKRIDQRLAAQLLRRVDGRSAEIPATHQELAEDLGCSREVVSRTLESFRDQGLLLLGRGRISFLNRQGLRRIAEEPL